MDELGNEWPRRVVCLAAPGHQEIYCSEIASFVLGVFFPPVIPSSLIPWHRVCHEAVGQL